MRDIWREGDMKAYVPFCTYHFPFAYSTEKRTEYFGGIPFPGGQGYGNVLFMWGKWTFK
ncbi:MAG: hypothetical protein NWQ00_05255 [Burkholderiaceae bacterium]|nr:hypothetical protein [Burkholderiaceae bacterium]MDP4970175.1 hypothetical protein [Burkholderiaceae bacterium]MDP5111832.1 hypothetical protein [Burkholderiaceae bacterium]